MFSANAFNLGHPKILSFGKELNGMISNLFQMTNFRLFKWKEFADDNFNLHENGRMFAKSVVNTGENQEIACYEQFLLPHQRLGLQTRKNKGLFGKGLSFLFIVHGSHV